MNKKSLFTKFQNYLSENFEKYKIKTIMGEPMKIFVENLNPALSDNIPDYIVGDGEIYETETVKNRCSECGHTEYDRDVHRWTDKEKESLLGKGNKDENS